MKFYIFIFIPFFGLKGQTLPPEAKAFDYLMTRFNEIRINYKTDTVKFDTNKNKIWCDSRVMESLKNEKILVHNALVISYGEFKNQAGEARDVCILIHKAVADSDFHLVKFEIISRDGSTTFCNVPLDAKNEPYALFLSYK